MTDWLNATALQPREFEQIRDLAHRAAGLDLRPEKRELVSARLRRLVHGGGFGSFEEYYRRVRGDSSGAALAAMIDALVTNHTAFLRESDHFEFLSAHVAPLLKGRDTIDVWSAACSTGEEVWTLAMVLNEALAQRQIRILGSDISNRALASAAEATYPASRCEGLPRTWLARYFVAPGNAKDDDPARDAAWRVCPRIRAQAEFRRINLLDASGWSRRFPVIFCRNVMIYFDRSTRQRVVRNLAGCLEPGGFLFTGLAESLGNLSDSLEYVRPAVYRKPGGEASSGVRQAAPFSRLSGSKEPSSNISM